MITHPEEYLEAFARAGADSLVVHPEVCRHLQRTLVQIRDLGVNAGVALNPATTEDGLRYVLPWLDVVLVMTVNPGFGGQQLIPEVLPKIRRVRQMLDEVNPAARISVDGGVNLDTAPSVLAHGADTLVAGSAIFKASEGVAKAIAAFRSCAKQ
jgi:ribulose-phosphate 3-epimerase